MSLSNNTLQFQKLSDHGRIPTKAHEGDAGYDIYSAFDLVIPARSTRAVDTDICVRLPDPPMDGMSVYGRIAERSGLAMKKSLSVGGGVVDKGFTGSLGVILHNHSDEDFEVKIGDRIAQFLVTLIMTPCVEEVDNISSEVTERGAGGFGSSGTS